MLCGDSDCLPTNQKVGSSNLSGRASLEKKPFSFGRFFLSRGRVRTSWLYFLPASISHSPRGEIMGSPSMLRSIERALSPVTKTSDFAESAAAMWGSSSGSGNNGEGRFPETRTASLLSRAMNPFVTDSDWPSFSGRIRSSSLIIESDISNS